MRRLLGSLAAVACASALAAPAFAADQSIGFGLHYWRSAKDLVHEGFGDLKRDGVSQVVTYQYIPEGLLRLELDAEYFPNDFVGSTNWAISPQAYVLVGHGIYLGPGVGWTYTNDNTPGAKKWSDTFFALKGGFDMALAPAIHLDINGNYRFNDWKQIHQIKSDTVTLGATLKFIF